MNLIKLIFTSICAFSLANNMDLTSAEPTANEFYHLKSYEEIEQNIDTSDWVQIAHQFDKDENFLIKFPKNSKAFKNIGIRLLRIDDEGMLFYVSVYSYIPETFDKDVHEFIDRLKGEGYKIPYSHYLPKDESRFSLLAVNENLAIRMCMVKGTPPHRYLVLTYIEHDIYKNMDLIQPGTPEYDIYMQHELKTKVFVDSFSIVN